jgi:hypothetical protein
MPLSSLPVRHQDSGVDSQAMNGTFSIDDGVFEVLANAGDTHLGGEDFNSHVIDYFVMNYKKRPLPILPRTAALSVS